jgi:large subunit ribosomal protein L9
MTMEVILKQDVTNLGHKDDIIKVRDGYGRNYLIPKGMAIMATQTSKKVHAENMRQRAHKEEKIRDEAMAMAKKLENAVLKIGAKTSTTGKIFGSVNTIQIAEAISNKGYAVDRKNITLYNEDSIKEVGTYKAKVKLHKDVVVDITFEVIAD